MRKELRFGWVSRLLLFQMIMLLGSAAVGEVVAPVPEGWLIDPTASPATVVSGTVSVALYEGTSPYTQSRIMQIVGSTPVYTDLPGKAFSLEYSPDAAYLLVHQVSVDWPRGRIRVTLLGVDGSIIWARDDTRIFHFSTSGERIYSSPRESALSAGSYFEILDLAGNTLKTVDFSEDTGPLKAFILLGQGDDAVIALQRTIRRVHLSEGTPATVWTVDLAENDPRLTFLRTLEDGRIVAILGFGHFKVLTTDGTVEYTYDPHELAENDPDRDFDFYTGYRAFTGDTPNELWLFKRSAALFDLNLQSGTLSEGLAGFESPDGFTLRQNLEDQSLVLLSTTQLRIHSLAGP